MVKKKQKSKKDKTAPSTAEPPPARVTRSTAFPAPAPAQPSRLTSPTLSYCDVANSSKDQEPNKAAVDMSSSAASEPSADLKLPAAPDPPLPSSSSSKRKAKPTTPTIEEVTIDKGNLKEPSPISTSSTQKNVNKPSPSNDKSNDASFKITTIHDTPIDSSKPSPSSGTFDSNGLDSQGYTKSLRRKIKDQEQSGLGNPFDNLSIELSSQIKDIQGTVDKRVQTTFDSIDSQLKQLSSTIDQKLKANCNSIDWATKQNLSTLDDRITHSLKRIDDMDDKFIDRLDELQAQLDDHQAITKKTLDRIYDFAVEANDRSKRNEEKIISILENSLANFTRTHSDDENIQGHSSSSTKNCPSTRLNGSSSDSCVPNTSNSKAQPSRIPSSSHSKEEFPSNEILTSAPQDEATSSGNSIRHKKKRHSSKDTSRLRSRRSRRYSRSSRSCSRSSSNSSDESDASETKNMFGQNKFSLVCSEKRIKYADMMSYLKDKKLSDDSEFQLERLYNSICRSLAYAFQRHIDFMPVFRKLDKTTCFRHVFLRGLHDATLATCESVFDRLGENIKDILTSTNCISESQAPKAFDVISTNNILDGWDLLRKLLAKRSVLCGAQPDVDLTFVLANLTLKNGESYGKFYTRVSHLVNRFRLQTRSDDNIPMTRICNRFVQELNRANEYVPHLTTYYSKLRHHLKVHGLESTSPPLSFTIEEIYDHLDQVDAPSIPSSLRPSTVDRQQQHLQESTNTIESTTQSNDICSISRLEATDNNFVSNIASFIASPDFESMIASFDYSEPATDCINPSICKNETIRRRCQVCLRGFHDEINCYLRGQAFMPDSLRQRINIYNKVNGDKPPAGHKPAEWKPTSIPAIHRNKKETSQSTSEQKVNRQRYRPFSNNKTKVDGSKQQIKTFESIDTTSTSDDQQKDVLASFVSNQVQDINHHGDHYLQNDDFDDDDDTPSICSMSTEQLVTLKVTSTSSAATSTTPSNLITSILNLHQRNGNQPCRRFLSQHAIEISKLPSSLFQPLTSAKFQVDSGANVCATNDSNLFYFYIPQELSVEQASGSTFSSQGWGAILFRINGQVRVLSPVHFTPSSTKSIFSPNALRTFSAFKRAVHAIHEGVYLVDNVDKEYELEVSAHNTLDFTDIEVMRFRCDSSLIDPSINSQSLEAINISSELLVTASDETEKASTRSTTANVDKFLSNGFRFPKNVMSLIASYYVHLHDFYSPRVRAINNMNCLLGNHYTSFPRDTPFALNPLPAVTSLENNNTLEIVPILNKLCRKVSRNLDDWQEYIHLHLTTMHMSDSTLQPMLDRKLLQDLPNIGHKVGKFDCSCVICSLTKSTKLPRGSPVDYSKLPPFTQIHLDFSLYGHVSIRGFVSALDIICASTCYPFGFPCKNRNPPLETIRWFINTLRVQGHQPAFIRVDEDGALAQSAEFCSLIIELSLVLQTTSGGNSLNNGKVERPHATTANMIRSSLSTMNHLMGDIVAKVEGLQIEDFWCFCYTNSVHIRRRIYNRSVDDIPFYLVHGKRPSARELVLPGAIMSITNPQKGLLPKLSNDRGFRAHFLGFGNNIRSLIIWDPRHPKSFKRAHHGIVEDMATLEKLQSLFLTPHSLAITSRSELESKVRDKIITSRTFDLSSSAFPVESIFTVTVPLPPLGTPLGLSIRDDYVFTIPFIYRTQPGSFIHQHLPAGRRTNQFILNINSHGPITARFAIDHIKDLQKKGHDKITLDLVRRGHGDTTTSLNITRAMFDQLPQFLATRPIISSTESTTKAGPSKPPTLPPSHDVFVRSPSKPKAPKLWHETQSSHLRKNWKAAAWEGFCNNKKIAVFSLPFPKSELPEGERVFKTILVPEVKDTDVPGVWKLRVRECIVGTPQKKSIDFRDSYSPTVDGVTVKLQISFCAVRGYYVAVIDVKNAFQNTISRWQNRIYVTVPPTYLEWLMREEGLSFDEKVTYLRQMLNANQGTKDAGNQWYALLLAVLYEYGLVRSTVDHGFLVKKVTDCHYLYVSLATDDIFCGFHSYAVLEDLAAFLRKYFTIVVQTGGVIKFLGYRIIQSDRAISIDQAPYCYEMLEDYFGTDPERTVKTVSIPMRSDAEFERELYESPPLSPTELQDYCFRYRGGFRHHTGKLVFAVDTRFDFQFAVQRLSEFNCAPTAASFEGVDRIMRYIAQDVLRPLVYPRASFAESNLVTITLTPEKKETLRVKNLPSLFTDAELARDLATRRSYYCVVVTVVNVIVLCKIKKTSKVMLHTTDSEAQASFDGVRRLLPIRALCEFMGLPLSDPTDHFVDNSAVNQIITSERMTPRCRHFDLPIAFLHEQHRISFLSKLVRSPVQLADIGTKPVVKFLHHRLKMWGSGAAYIPPPGHEHYILLQMHLYEKKYHEILQILSSGD